MLLVLISTVTQRAHPVVAIENRNDSKAHWIFLNRHHFGGANHPLKICRKVTVAVYAPWNPNKQTTNVFLHDVSWRTNPDPSSGLTKVPGARSGYLPRTPAAAFDRRRPPVLGTTSVKDSPLRLTAGDGPVRSGRRVGTQCSGGRVGARDCAPAGGSGRGTVLRREGRGAGLCSGRRVGTQCSGGRVGARDCAPAGGSRLGTVLCLLTA